MNKIWFQLTGTHRPGQPQRVLHADNKFFIGGCHTMNDPKLKQVRQDKDRGRPYDFLSLSHTRQPVICPQDASGYPKYSWWYHNKLEGQQAFQRAQQVLRFDPNAHLIYFSCTPMRNALILARLLKTNVPNKVTMIHYKRYFWRDQVEVDGSKRNLIDNPIVPLNMQHLVSRKIQQQMIRMSDVAYLADSQNINGGQSDPPRKIAQMLASRDKYLAANPKVKLFSMVDKVYEVYDRVEH